MVRECSTRATTEGVAGDNLSKYARKENVNIAESHDIYKQRIQEIWRRQQVALGGEMMEEEEEIDFDDDEESVGEGGEGGDEEFEAMEDDEGEGGNEEEDDDEEDDFAEDLLEQLGDKQSAKSTAATHGAEGMFGQGGQKQRGDIKKVIEDAAQLQALRQDLADRKNDGKVDSAGSAGKKKKAAKIMVVKKKVRIM